MLNAEERRTVARAHVAQLAQAVGLVAMILPNRGLGEWDRAGGDLHDAAGLDAFLSELRATLPERVERHEIAAHITDAPFADRALAVFDAWCATGHVAGGT